jgi:cellulose biosynthesis protein BcsQ
MTAYAFWNNKGGVGKSFLCFIAASEYAHRHPEADVYVIDLCPQANVSETLFGGYGKSTGAMNRVLGATPRASVAGYIEERLSSPFKMITNIAPYISHPSDENGAIPGNLYLICGDNLLEVLSEAIRQTAQLPIPTDAWKIIIGWIKDLISALRESSGERDSFFVIDCNPSFAVYTQLALVSADYVVVPFTADDSSRRAIENVVALLYGVSDDPHASRYARISFAKRAAEEGLVPPKLHTFVSNRVTFYEGRPSKAFEVASQRIKKTVRDIYKSRRSIFALPGRDPTESFIEVPDYHSASIVAAVTGTPLHRLKPGPRMLGDERVQINIGPLKSYREALAKFVDSL